MFPHLDGSCPFIANASHVLRAERFDTLIVAVNRSAIVADNAQPA